MLLRLVGRRLQRCIRAGDVAARLSGDEFALIVHAVAAPDEIHAFALRLLGRLRRPMRLGASCYAPSFSVGIAPFPSKGCGPHELLGNADAALLDAKRQGRGRHVLFAPNWPTGWCAARGWPMRCARPYPGGSWWPPCNRNSGWPMAA
jgi:diguanylate cyclase (GGDEF)-like protein